MKNYSSSMIHGNNNNNNNRRDMINQQQQLDSDMDQNEQQMPMSYDNERYNNANRSLNNYTNNRNMNFNNNAKSTTSTTTTQPPLRNQYNDFSDMKMNYQQQQFPPPDVTPIYVPPFLLNNARPSRQNHNAPLDYLPWSIANIFICVIIALPALFFSVQTRDMKRAGNIKKAKINSKRSLILNIIASVVGLLTILLAVILRFALYQLFVQNDVNSLSVPIIAGG